jgi:hypothetical protein
MDGRADAAIDDGAVPEGVLVGSDEQPARV